MERLLGKLEWFASLYPHTRVLHASLRHVQEDQRDPHRSQQHDNHCLVLTKVAREDLEELGRLLVNNEPVSVIDILRDPWYDTPCPSPCPLIL